MNPAFIDIHTHFCTPEKEVRKVCVYLLGRNEPLPDGAFTAGVHPWDVEKVPENSLGFFDEPPAGLIGIGEIGLDFALENADRKLQIEWFEKQLELTERLRFPVVLHCVKAYNEMQSALKKWNLKAVVFHGFIGSPELARQLTDQGYYLSFGERTWKSPKTMEALKITPLEKLFLETDDDPQADIRRLYAETAKQKGISTDELKEAIYNNYRKIF